MSEKTLRKIQNYVYKIRNFYRNDIKPKLRKYFDVLTTLYEDRKIENERTLQNAINLLKKGDKKKAKETINKYKDALTMAGVINGSKDQEFHLTALVHRVVQYTLKSGNKNSIHPKMKRIKIYFKNKI